MSLREFALRSQAHLPASLRHLSHPLVYSSCHVTTAASLCQPPQLSGDAHPSESSRREWYYLQADIVAELLHDVHLDSGPYRVLQGATAQQDSLDADDASISRGGARYTEAAGAKQLDSGTLRGSRAAFADGPVAAGMMNGTSVAAVASRGLRVSQQPRMWVSPCGAISPLHYDRSASCLTQVRGRKSMVFVPPGDLHRTYPYPDTHMLARRSRVNVHAPDNARFPEFARISGSVEAVLGPGDLVFFGPMWAHYTESLTMSVSVTCRYDVAMQAAARSE